jgi:predicted small lipoprotein YifL
MKKFLVLSLALAMVLGMTACGDKTPATPDSEVQDTVTDTVTDEVTDEVTDGVTDEVVDVPVDEVVVDAKIEKAFADVKEALKDNYWPNMPVDATYLSEMFGINMDNVDSFYGEIPMISAHVDTLVVLKAKADCVDAVKADLEARRDAMIADTMQYPSNIPVIQQTIVGVAGDYVYYICMAGDTTSVQEQGEAAIADLAKGVMTTVEDTIKCVPLTRQRCK